MSAFGAGSVHFVPLILMIVNLAIENTIKNDVPKDNGVSVLQSRKLNEFSPWRNETVEIAEIKKWIIPDTDRFLITGRRMIAFQMTVSFI